MSYEERGTNPDDVDPKKLSVAQRIGTHVTLTSLGAAAGFGIAEGVELMVLPGAERHGWAAIVLRLAGLAFGATQGDRLAMDIVNFADEQRQKAPNSSQDTLF